MKRDGVRCKEKANGHSFPYSHAFSIWFLLYLYLVFPFFLLLPQILTSKIYCRTHSSLNPVNNVDENRTREARGNGKRTRKNNKEKEILIREKGYYLLIIVNPPDLPEIE